MESDINGKAFQVILFIYFAIFFIYYKYVSASDKSPTRSIMWFLKLTPLRSLKRFQRSTYTLNRGQRGQYAKKICTVKSQFRPGNVTAICSHIKPVLRSKLSSVIPENQH